jgi:preprotein translocase subunit SecF
MARTNTSEKNEKKPGKSQEVTRGRFDFMGARKHGYMVSAILILIALGSLATQGLNWGIDFRGGSVYRYRFSDPQRATLPEIRNRASAKELKEKLGHVRVQAIAATEAGTAEYLIFTGFTERDAKDDPIPALEARFVELGGAVQLSANEVGPTIGQTIKANAAKALLLAVAGMLFYITIRFETKWGVAAVLALIHDVVIVVGVFSVLQREITSDSLAALLTIIGYSLNDTIVIIDRVRENMGVHAIKRKLGYAGVFNLSINQSLSRTINTSVTTMFPVVALLLFGGLVIRDFALALFVGVLAGTYSSIFVVSSVLVDWYYRDHPGVREKDEAKAASAS